MAMAWTSVQRFVILDVPMAGEATWPLTRAQHELLAMLATMIGKFGRERFLEAPVVRADARDFPDKWTPTLQAVHQLAYRLCWHAHIEPAIVVEDHRPLHDDRGLLRDSSIDVTAQAGTITLAVQAIGNDDVAGLLAHAIGRAFLDLSPGEPFRSAHQVSDEVEGSVAAVFLGLGMLAANASLYRRHAAEIRGRDEYSEQKMAAAGGLDICEATLLLAIQDILRDDVSDALSTLHGPQKDWVEQWRDVLDPHEAELRAALGLDETHEPHPLTRATAPRVAPAADEQARLRINAGLETMRVRQRSYSLAGIGVALTLFGLGFALALLGSSSRRAEVPLVVLGLIGTGGLALTVRGLRAYYTCTDTRCFRIIGANETRCPFCGGTVTKTITMRDLKAHWAALRAAEDAADELIDPSEFAGDPEADAARSDRAPRVRVASRGTRGRNRP